MLEVSLDISNGSFHLQMEACFRGGITGVFGPSGVGKTTLLNAIAGILPAQRVICGDRTFTDAERNIHLPVHRRKIAVVFQESRLFPHMTVRQNLRFGMRDLDESRFTEVVEGLALELLLDKPAPQLSGGEGQRVALGRALLSRPDWLLLDEPLVSLDRGAQLMLLKFLKHVHQSWQLPMLFVSHNLAELLFLTQDILVLQAGSKLAHGRYHDILRQPEVLNAMHDLGLVNLLSLLIAENREAEGITLLKSGSLIWSAPLCDHPIGTRVACTLRPEDIALIDKPVGNISMQNQMRGEVRDVVMSRNRALVYLDVGIELIVEVTPHAARALDLQRGGTMYGLFKAQAIKFLS